MGKDKKGGIGPAPDKDPGTALEDLFDSAKAEDLGKVEEGSNRGAFVDMVNRQAGVSVGSFWCATWMTYRVKKTAAKWGHKVVVFMSPGVVNMINLNKAKLHQKPKKGDLCLMQYGTSGDGHCGIVGNVKADGSHESIEGNTNDNDPNTRNGGAIAINMRKPGGAYGKLRVRGYITPYSV